MAPGVVHESPMVVAIHNPLPCAGRVELFRQECDIGGPIGALGEYSRSTGLCLRSAPESAERCPRRGERPGEVPGQPRRLAEAILDGVQRALRVRLSRVSRRWRRGRRVAASRAEGDCQPRPRRRRRRSGRGRSRGAVDGGHVRLCRRHEGRARGNSQPRRRCRRRRSGSGSSRGAVVGCHRRRCRRHEVSRLDISNLDGRADAPARG